MSSIIDALKKSDAKRPNKNHGLNIRMDLKNHTEKKNRWGFYAIIMALVIILAAVYFKKPDYVWQHFGAAEQPVVAATNTPEKTTTPKQTNKLKKPTPQQVQSAAKEQAAATPVIDDKPAQTKNPEPQNKPADVAQINEDKTTQANITETQVKPKDSSNEIQTDNQVQQDIDQQLAATPMKNKQAINPPPKDTKKQVQTEPNLPQLYELPYAIRKDLPKLNLSVHVYDPVVENRMAILNGVPIHVGDTFEELISIQDITQSGVILRIQDRDFIVLK